VLTLRWLFVIAISVFTLASIGCAFSGSFPTLVSFRVLQGFAGGALIPAVFSAVFLLFPTRLHPIATTMAGIMAVLAPTVGPVVGGWITETYSWHWLFLINVAPGVVAAAATPFLLPNDRPRFADLATLDGYSLTLMAISLASLEIGLKQAPQDGWLSPLCALLFALSVGCDAAKGETLNVIDSDDVRAWRYAGELIRDGVANVRRRIALPYALGLAVAMLASAVARLLLGPDRRLPGILIPERYRARFRSLRFPNQKAVRILGWKPGVRAS
jgi:MFS family permease